MLRRTTFIAAAAAAIFAIASGTCQLQKNSSLARRFPTTTPLGESIGELVKGLTEASGGKLTDDGALPGYNLR